MNRSKLVRGQFSQPQQSAAGRERSNCQDYLGWTSALTQACSGQLWHVSVLLLTPESTNRPVSTSLALVHIHLSGDIISHSAEVKEEEEGCVKTYTEDL